MLRRLSRAATIVLAAASLSGLEAAEATTIHVPLDEPTIQAGVNAAEEGDTVLVAPGVYSGAGNYGIAIDRDIFLISEMGAEETIIDCEETPDAPAIIVSAWYNPRPVIRGFSLVNASFWSGGGIAAIDADPVVSECIFSNCSAQYGGAVFCENAWPTIERCRIVNNTAEKGGGIYCWLASAATIIDCVIAGNTATTSGGGLSLEYNPSPGAVDGCTIVANDSPVGAGIAFGDARSLQVTNTIIAFNGPGEGVACTGPVPSYVPDITRCCVFGNAGGDSLCGEHFNNFYSDPLFCDLAAGDFTLCSTSPCLPGYNPWRELVGALAQGCGKCSSPVEPASWGRLKAMYLPGRD